MTTDFADQAVIRRLLNESRTWAFVGLGDNPEREVHSQARLMQQRGKRIIPVHPAAREVLGEKGYASLADVPDASEVDVVGVYRRAEHAGQAVDEAIAAGAKAVWLQLGVINEEAAARAEAAGLKVVMDRCPAIEIPRLGLRRV